MTRTRARSLPGQVTSAALDGDLLDGGRSGTQPRGYNVESSGRTSLYYSYDESTPETEVLLTCKRGDSDNPGRVQLSGGGEQVSAEAGAGANQDIRAGGDLAGSTNRPAGHHAPASLPSESTQPQVHFDARAARGARQSIGALISATTPEAFSRGQDASAHSEAALMLASTMAPAEAQKYLVLVQLEHHMRIQGNTTMADGYANLIMKLLDTQFFGASGSAPSAGSSGGSTGMGASSMIAAAASFASLSCDAITLMQAPKQPAEFKISASESKAAASVANNDAGKPSTLGRGRPAAQTGGGQSRPSTTHHKNAGRCYKGAQCPVLASGQKCQWQHTPGELAAAKAATTEVEGTAGGFAESGFMAAAAPLTAISGKLPAASRQVRFAKSASNIGTSLRQQPPAAKWAEPKRTARRPTVGAYTPKLLNPNL